MERFGVPRGKRPRVQVSLDDKERAIARIRGGETKAGISRELGVPESTVRGWVKRAEQRMARETASQTGSANYPSILALTLAKPQVTISTKSSASSVISKSSYSSPPLDLKSLKLPQKRNINGHPVARTHDPVEKVSAATTIPIPVPIPMPLPVPPIVSPDSEQQMNAWLHIFNAGLLNFTLIATAAVLQARSRGLADRLPLWQIIADFVDEAGRNVNANGGRYLEGHPATGHTSPTQRTVQVPTQVHSYRGKFKPPPAHITAEDDDDCYTDTDVPH
ncbi:uncharacterized protein LOC6530537 [Drosophila yakuba]|uniref:HTH psq-type domain-containing protein n=1 Tax=Drosophila yakuba TaxID=7245 RepID=B4P8C4_DROYA|nr:uncharacterized protein LOC6530537 [Drosophila yakuba]EDW91164.1 uncharacterized protein Dyak_GE13663 [Drosophila yakuba]